MDFSQLAESYTHNVVMFPGILAALANELGVSPASLTKLGVGYAPVIQFKDRAAFGWWSTPERDEAGNITGLSLRKAGDGTVKPMYPGSKHGLMYPTRDSFAPGAKPYIPGAHNWIRLTDAGLECPVCGKPDGCLLSADDPDNPAAVICIREESGRPQSLGYLHILRPEGHVHTGSPLPANPLPIVIVEGMSDAATAIDMGFVAIGRASALFTNGLPALIRGRKVIVVGENDPAGIRGMHTTFAVIQPHASEAVMVLPPPDAKDLRQWRARHNLTAQDVLDAATTRGERTSSVELLPSDEPMVLAKEWLKANYWSYTHDRPTLLSYYGTWFAHDGTKYVEYKNVDVLDGELYNWFSGRRYLKGEDEVAVLVPNRHNMSEVRNALKAYCPVNIDPPSWLDGDTADPANMIVYQNGILHVDRYFAGDDHMLTPLTPAFFTLAAIPYDFDPEATCPTWLYYLDSTFSMGPDGRDRVKLLQEWFGYNMVADLSQEKLLLMYGRSGCGKGTAITAMEALLGKHQVAATKMRTLGETFGLEALMGKLAAIMPDIRISRNTDSMQALEIILNIVGRDTVDVNRKHKPNLGSVVLTTRITMAANELPELPDHSQALARRLLILPFEESFVGRADITLKDKLVQEAPGIALWALAGLRRLREQGKFTGVESSLQLYEKLRRVTSPAVEFVETCFDVDPVLDTPQDVLYAAWKGWMSDRMQRPGSWPRLQQRIEAAFPKVRFDEEACIMRGLEIRPDAFKKFAT